MTFAALGNAVLFVVIGFLLFGAAFAIIVRVLPGDLWSRALDGSVSAAVIVAALALSLDFARHSLV